MRLMIFFNTLVYHCNDEQQGNIVLVKKTEIERIDDSIFQKNKNKTKQNKKQQQQQQQKTLKKSRKANQL